MNTDKISKRLLLVLWIIAGILVLISIPLSRGIAQQMWWVERGAFSIFLLFIMPAITACLMATSALMLKSGKHSRGIFCYFLSVAALVVGWIFRMQIAGESELVGFGFMLMPIAVLGNAFMYLPLILFFFEKLRKNKIVGIVGSVLIIIGAFLFGDGMAIIILGLVLAFFVLSLYGIFDSGQNKFLAVPSTISDLPPVPPLENNSGELEKYRKLLARGLITQEEFEQFKNRAAK